MEEAAAEIKPPSSLASPPTLKVLEAETGPETLSWLVIVDDPTEIYPPPKIERLATVKVEEAEIGPVTFNWEEIVEEPLTIKPPKLVNLAASLKTPAFKVEKAKKPVPWP